MAGVPQPDTVAEWSVHPLFTSLNSAGESGLAIDFENKRLLDVLALKASASARLADESGEQRAKYTGSLKYDPDLPAGVAKSLQLEFGGLFSNVEKVATDLEASAEMDYSLPLAQEISLGVVGYLDSHDPDSGVKTSGGTVGITSEWSFDPLTSLDAEYDWKSDFAGEDNALAKLSRRVVASPSTTVAVGIEKHGKVSVEMKIGYFQLRPHKSE